METAKTKPLGAKAYGSIPHLPGSRLGPKDYHCHEGQARIACEKPRDKRDTIIVQEKLDGSCCAVAKVQGQILALGRAGWLAQSSPYEQHQLFAAWVREREQVFRDILSDGERLVGEWLAQAHSTRYTITDPWDAFVVFDLIQCDPEHPKNQGLQRATLAALGRRLDDTQLRQPHLLSAGPPVSIEQAMSLVGKYGFHDAQDVVEGAVWRVEREGAVDFLTKYVRHAKVDGSLLPEVSGQPIVWNWRP